MAMLGSTRKAVSFAPANLTNLPKYETDNTETVYRESLSKLRNILTSKQSFEVVDDKARENLNLNLVPTLNNYSNIKNVAKTVPNIHFHDPPSALLTLQKIAKGHSNLGADSNDHHDLLDLLEKQSEQLVELENERSQSRQELNSVLSKVKDVIYENEELHAEERRRRNVDGGDNSLFKFSPKSEKLMRDSKIAELEAQLLQYKRNLRLAQEEHVKSSNDESAFDSAGAGNFQFGVSSCSACKTQAAQLESMKREKEEHLAMISKLEEKFRDFRERENEGLRKLKLMNNERDQIKDKKSQAELEIIELKEELDRQQNRNRDLILENSKKFHDQKLEVEKKYHQELDHLKFEMSQDDENLTKVKIDLERQKRIEAELRRELQLKISVLEDMRSEMKTKLDHLQGELSHALSQKSSTEQDLMKSRLQTEKMEREEKHESNRLRTELTLVRTRLEIAEEDLRQSKDHVRNLNKEIGQLQRGQSVPLEGHMNRDGDISSIIHAMEDKQLKSIAELEQLINAQNNLMDNLRGECKLLAEKLEETTEQNRLNLLDAVRQRLQSGSPAYSPIISELTSVLEEINAWTKSHPTDETETEKVDSQIEENLNSKDGAEAADSLSQDKPESAIRKWQIQIESMIERFSPNRHLNSGQDDN